MNDLLQRPTAHDKLQLQRHCKMPLKFINAVQFSFGSHVCSTDESNLTICNFEMCAVKYQCLPQQKQHDEAMEFLRTQMGQNIYEKTRKEAVTEDLSPEQKAIYVKRFRSLDTENKGYISINDLRRGLKV